jgi:hypothetical protein
MEQTGILTWMVVCTVPSILKKDVLLFPLYRRMEGQRAKKKTGDLIS